MTALDAATLRTEHLAKMAIARWLLVTCLVACSSSKTQPPARTAGACVEKGARTGVAGAKTGVITGVEGVKTFGKAVGGFVEGGSDQARREWQQGKQETRSVARGGAQETRGAARSGDCR